MSLVGVAPSINFLVSKFEKNSNGQEDNLIQIAADKCFIVATDLLSNIDTRFELLNGQILIHPIYRHLKEIYGENISIRESGVVVLKAGAPPGDIHTDYGSIRFEGMFEILQLKF